MSFKNYLCLTLNDKVDMSPWFTLNNNSFIRLIELKPHLRNNKLFVRLKGITEWAELVLEDSFVKEAQSF